jgi:hypothetical protein
VSEATNLRDRSAVKVLADEPVMDRLADAVAKSTGLSYLDSLERYQTRLEALGPAATVGEVLGKDATEILPAVKLLEAYTERTQRTLDTALSNAADGAQVVEGQVLISPDTDTAPWLADPLEHERRLRRMRAARQDGAFHGDHGRAAFKKADREAIEVGWDPVATAEFENAARQARAQAQAEASQLQAPLDATAALRQERLQLDSELQTLDRRVEAAEAEAEDLKRRGVVNGQAVPIGRLLERRREVAKRLERVTSDRRIELSSVPGYQVMLEQERAEVNALETDAADYSPLVTANVENARKFMLENECDFMTALDAVEDGKITLDRDES